MEKVSVPFFSFPQKTLTKPPKKHTACNRASKNYNWRSWVTKRTLEGCAYLTYIFSAMGSCVDNPHGPPSSAFCWPGTLFCCGTHHQAGPARTFGGCSLGNSHAPRQSLNARHEMTAADGLQGTPARPEL